jgi:hypothetical protein
MQKAIELKDEIIARFKPYFTIVLLDLNAR